ncbi:MAG: hypothetical protein O3A93_07235 [Chloroflexi bacterium]|nr:hypothetical protein [Chloroflexota bacterium]MDA1271037.1 hypothetical protein [Chloroflexota bacterium]
MAKKRDAGQEPGADADLPFNRIVYQIEETKVGSGYEAVCPELVITGFGDTAEEAKSALRRQVAEYLEDCEKMEALDETLIEAGFYFNGEVWMSNEVEPAQEPKIRFIGRPPE